mmetsp:Transcript_26365/g.54022  ORF Transcript_26365/g.54022 Transcript_26365/m.54022 type:complete len:188 (-) Transcript_26365:328-891(-)
MTAATQNSMISQMMTDSTIYRRHERRLARSYAQRDDPRPAAVRVLSGLPGFRNFIQPHVSLKSPEPLSDCSSDRASFLSEGSVFTLHENGKSEKLQQPLTTSYLPYALAIGSAGVGWAVLQRSFPYHLTPKSIQPLQGSFLGVSPFATNRAHFRQAPFSRAGRVMSPILALFIGYEVLSNAYTSNDS